ncbi:3'-5' exonuclease [Aliidiomarina maris]|uniref:3'-5' exonuclease n=1 Tax=Aliidiomarina maris TaxID=531312 RepID=A0A327X7L1_9GAMM|nr:3'-5' exonuclease [Aliidiomarina maris]RAK01642.1 DNA polymerase-3 subunit epsilon [Aliidiomarina maris]RUO28466.1 3'-5' exonuclease [Aliidiomarina maris]
MIQPRTVLGFDSETTGLPVWGKPSGGDDQPHLVEIAGKLVDAETKEVLGQVNLIIKPNGWVIPDDVIKVHGITNEIAHEQGHDEKQALLDFLDLWKQADLRVAHNQSFDDRIIRIAIKRYLNEEIADEWKNGAKACTGLLAKPIMQMPPKSRWGYKMPKLSEAYKHFMGKELEGAHRAMTDVDACLAVYFAITDQQEAA